MKSMETDHQSPTVVTQLRNNTSIWIGHLKSDPTDHFAGQIFNCPASGDLRSIELFSSAVQSPGEMVLTLHSFDSENRNWGPQLVSATVDVQKSDSEKWIRFMLPPLPLHKDENYGFRVRAHDAMVALGEAAAGTDHPFSTEEWHADSQHQDGHYYKYFNLAYKVEMCSSSSSPEHNGGTVLKVT